MLTKSKTVFIVVLMSVIGNRGCDGKRKALRERLDQLRLQRDISKHKVEGIERTISSLQDELNASTENLRTRRSAVAEYMNDHKTAIECMAAVGYSLGRDNVFSDEVNDIIRAGAIVCGLLMLDEQFRSEVASP